MQKNPVKAAPEDEIMTVHSLAEFLHCDKSTNLQTAQRKQNTRLQNWQRLAFYQGQYHPLDARFRRRAKALINSRPAPIPKELIVKRAPDRDQSSKEVMTLRDVATY